MVKSYHFSLGNSADGPVGFCASVTARTPEEAVEILKEHIETEVALVNEHSLHRSRWGAVEYARAYVNPEAITTADIDSEEDLPEAPVPVSYTAEVATWLGREVDSAEAAPYYRTGYTPQAAAHEITAKAAG
jgi:hypothetical protein